MKVKIFVVLFLKIFKTFLREIYLFDLTSCFFFLVWTFLIFIIIIHHVLYFSDLNQRLVDAENSSKSVQNLHKELENAKLGFEKKEQDYIATIKESKTNLEEVTKKLVEKESALLLPNSPNVSVLGIF